MGRKVIDPVSKGVGPEFVGDMHQFGPHIHYDDNRMVFLAGDMNEYSVSNVIQNIFFNAQRDANKPIYLVISSYGGEVDSMFSLYDAMKYVNCPIYTVGLGAIMSASVLVLAAGEKKNRKMGKNARIMMHPVSSINAGNVFEQQNQFKEMKRVQNRMTKLLADECNQDVKVFKKIMKKGFDKYITAQKALKLGIVDELI